MTICAELRRMYPDGRLIDAHQFWEDAVAKWPELDVPVANGEGSRAEQWYYYHCRNNRRYDLNRAASHPNIREFGCEPFMIDLPANNCLKFRTLTAKLTRADANEQTGCKAESQADWLRLWLEGVDWATVSEPRRLAIEENVEDFYETVDMLRMRENRIRHKLQRLLGTDSPDDDDLPPTPNP